MMREPKTEPIPAPDPATPTVAAPINVRETLNLESVHKGVGGAPPKFVNFF